MITRSDFRPLPDAPHLANAVVEVAPNVSLSVSYNLRYGAHEWYVGDYGSFQVAVQLSEEGWPHRSLVEFEDWGNNVKDRVSWSELDEIKERASTIRLFGRLWVFDTPDEKPCRWLIWGLSAPGYDHAQKVAWVTRIWTPEKYRVEENVVAGDHQLLETLQPQDQGHVLCQS